MKNTRGSKREKERVKYKMIKIERVRKLRGM
jgi:hypothetical protein